MNTNPADLVLNEVVGDSDIYISVNEPSRTLSHSGSLLIGVEDDRRAERIYFVSPRYLSEDIDLTSNNVRVYINISNANNQPHIYECENSENRVVLENGSIKFSWLIEDYVTAYSGIVKFNLCVKKFVIVDGVERIVNEWHTTPFQGTVLTSINVDGHTPESSSNPESSMYRITQIANNAVNSANNALALAQGLNAYTKQHIDETFATKEETNIINNQLNSIENTFTELESTTINIPKLQKVEYNFDKSKNEYLLYIESCTNINIAIKGLGLLPASCSAILSIKKIGDYYYFDSSSFEKSSQQIVNLNEIVSNMIGENGLYSTQDIDVDLGLNARNISILNIDWTKNNMHELLSYDGKTGIAKVMLSSSTPDDHIEAIVRCYQPGAKLIGGRTQDSIVEFYYTGSQPNNDVSITLYGKTSGGLSIYDSYNNETEDI